MSQRRVRNNALLLPNGKVLAVGGSTRPAIACAAAHVANSAQRDGSRRAGLPA